MATSKARKEKRRKAREKNLSPFPKVRKAINTHISKVEEQGAFIIPCSPNDVKTDYTRRALVIKRPSEVRRQLDRYTLISWSEARIINHRAKHNESKRARKRGFKKVKSQIRAEKARIRNPNYHEKNQYYKQTFGEKAQKQAQ